MRYQREPESPLVDLTPTVDDFRQDVLEGLGKSKKRIPCKYFYDERGTQLFEQICELTEYYPTRTELVIMQEHVLEMAERIGPGCRLVEFGSGSSLKTRFLLDTLPELVAYVPIDICAEALIDSHRDLSATYPELEILPVAGDFTDQVELPTPRQKPRSTVVYFPGSTIGNFPPARAELLFERMARLAGDGGAVLIGVDLKKDPRVLHRAYNDSRGITSAFNLNLLARINRELGADFQLDTFRHCAFYNPTKGRVEMHLISVMDQKVKLGKQEIEFADGESIRTEVSYKYELHAFTELASRGGLSVEAVWTDPRKQFSVQLLRVSST